MDIEAPYLQAIQAIAGKTPGEKQKTIHDIARRIAEAESSGGHSAHLAAEIPDVPEPLKPVVRVEVAKILRQYEGIIEALKSEDINVVSRALQAKWFFDGSDSRLVNAKYFLENVFPEISLYARLRIVKNLGTYLKDTAVAADFFLTLTQQYGVEQAVPLLEACDEDFVFKMTIENKIILSLRMVETLYRKYPNLVIKYLMLSKPGDEEVRNLYQINISNYEAFLPEVANTRFEDFMMIFHMHGSLNVKLGKKGAKEFFKTRMHLLVEKPNQYLKLLSLKSVTQKLRVDDFNKMFKNLFPTKEDAFAYSELNGYLIYYEPEQEKLPLILRTFREVYGKDFLSRKDLVDSDVMKMLPENDRFKLARLKLETDKDWYFYVPAKSWRCYLPISESIPLITRKIATSSDSHTRGQLLEQLIYTSKVNDDKNALLKVLNYIYDRHRNDEKWMFYHALVVVCNSFDLAKLSSAHWEILNKYIKWAEMQGDLTEHSTAMSEIIAVGLHYCLLNNLPLDDYVRMYVDINLSGYYTNFNILTDHPDLEKKFLDLFIEVIPKQYPRDNKIWEEKETDVIFNLAASLWNFNKRNNPNKDSNSKHKALYIKDYPWLFEKIKVNVFGKNDGKEYSIDEYLKRLRDYERDLYFEFLRELDEFWTFDVRVIFDVLKTYPQRVLDNWKECLDQVESTADRRRLSSVVISQSLWYDQLPVKFFKESLKKFNDLESCVGSAIILAMLTDGETYTKIIEPLIPKEKEMDVDDPKAKSTYDTLLGISKKLRKVNPAVPLDTIARFCVGDYLQMAIRSLTSVSRRVPVVKVIPFAKALIDRPVSVKKHGIRLMYLVAPLEEIYAYFTHLWESEGHTSIRLVVFSQVYHLFCKQPNSRSWRMVLRCLETLNTNDDEKLLNKLTGLSIVPNDYLCEYLQSVLKSMQSMEQKSEEPHVYSDILCKLIRNIDGPITRILPEEYCQDLIKNYLFVFDYNSDIFQAGLHLTIDSYLLSSKKYNESRFKFFGDFFRHSVKEYWNKSHPKNPKFYPLNVMVYDFFTRICGIAYDKHDLRVFESLLEIFHSALQPHQNAGPYLELVYSIEYHKSQTSIDFGRRIAEKIPKLVEIFSPECVIPMSNRLSRFIENREFGESESHEEKLMAIIEVLANSEAIHCVFFAVNMLFDNTSKELNERNITVIQSLRKIDHPGVAGLLNECLAKFGFSKDDEGSGSEHGETPPSDGECVECCEC